MYRSITGTLAHSRCTHTNVGQQELTCHEASRLLAGSQQVSNSKLAKAKSWGVTSVNLNSCRWIGVYTSKVCMYYVRMALCKVTFTRVVVLLFLIYLGYNCYILYTIFHPPECKKSQGSRCILPVYAKDKPLEARHRDLWEVVLHNNFNGSACCKLSIYYNN